MYYNQPFFPIFLCSASSFENDIFLNSNKNDQEKKGKQVLSFIHMGPMPVEPNNNYFVSG